MTDTPPETYEPTPAAQREALLRDSDFVSRWNRGDPAAIQQLDNVSRAAVGAGHNPQPRPPEAGTGMLTGDQARALAQQSIDAGADPNVVTAAMRADGYEDFEPDSSPPELRQWLADHEPDHPERYALGNLEHEFPDASDAERDNLSGVVRGVLAKVGLSREAGTEIARGMARDMSAFKAMSPDQRTAWQDRQDALLGSRRADLVKEATEVLQASGVTGEELNFLNRAGAVSADLVMHLAFLGQSVKARSA